MILKDEIMLCLRKHNSGAKRTDVLKDLAIKLRVGDRKDDFSILDFDLALRELESDGGIGMFRFLHRSWLGAWEDDRFIYIIYGE